MESTWTNSSDISSDSLEQIQRSLTVDLIMTPRKKLMTCRCEETAFEIKSRNKENFSFLPVMDDTDQILGLYKAEQWFHAEAPREQIGDSFEPFTETLVIGGDASIIDFVRVSDKEHPIRFVISGDCIAGLVSIFDLQKLPVRAAFFTLITRLEMVMAQRIDEIYRGADPPGWLNLLTKRRQNKIRDAVKKAKKKDGFVSYIAFSELSDKMNIVVKDRFICGNKESLKKEFGAICELRHAIAHANYYATSSEAAENTCKTINSILEIKQELTSLKYSVDAQR